MFRKKSNLTPLTIFKIFILSITILIITLQTIAQVSLLFQEKTYHSSPPLEKQQLLFVNSFIENARKYLPQKTTASLITDLNPELFEIQYLKYHLYPIDIISTAPTKPSITIFYKKLNAEDLINKNDVILYKTNKENLIVQHHDTD